MKPFIQIALSSGHVFEVPTQAIAENRAKDMLDLHKDEFADLAAALADTTELFEDSSEIRDWALNNMNPSDYLPGSRLILFTPPEQDFNTAEWSYHDAPAIVGELDGETIMQTPLEYVASVMAASRQLCGITMCRSQAADEQVGVAVFLGPVSVTNTYAQALEVVTRNVAAQINAVPANTH